MASIFTRIVNGEIPSYKVAENEEFYAFLDISPLTVGHTLVIPKREVDYIFDLTEDEIGRMMQFAQKIAKRIDSVVDCKRVAVAVIGLEVAHAHIHLIPITKEGDMNFSNEKLKLSKEEFEDICSRLRVE